MMSELSMDIDKEEKEYNNFDNEETAVSFGIGVDIGGTHILAVLAGKDG